MISIVNLCGSLEIKPTISKFICVGGMINVNNMSLSLLWTKSQKRKKQNLNI